jgi:hypothetical protein
VKRKASPGMDCTAGSRDPLAGMRASGDLSKQELRFTFLCLSWQVLTNKTGANSYSPKVELMLWSVIRQLRNRLTFCESQHHNSRLRNLGTSTSTQPRTYDARLEPFAELDLN